MDKVQLPLPFAAQLVVPLSQYWPLVLQLWLFATQPPLPLHCEAFRVVISEEQAFAAPQLCPTGG
jgi:hypothetical protein